MPEQVALIPEQPCPRAAALIEYCRAHRIPEVLPDTIEAGDGWGANCGPMSLAAVLGLPTVEAARPLVQPFRGFMAPIDMLDALNRASQADLLANFKLRRPADNPWPVLGLVRIQWVGPWCELSDPRIAYRYTHFVGVRRANKRTREALDLAAAAVEADRLGRPWASPDVLIYDATPNRWIPLAEWERWNPVLWPKRTTGWRPVTTVEVRL